MGKLSQIANRLVSAGNRLKMTPCCCGPSPCPPPEGDCSCNAQWIYPGDETFSTSNVGAPDLHTDGLFTNNCPQLVGFQVPRCSACCGLGYDVIASGHVEYNSILKRPFCGAATGSVSVDIDVPVQVRAVNGPNPPPFFLDYTVVGTRKAVSFGCQVVTNPLVAGGEQLQFVDLRCPRMLKEIPANMCFKAGSNEFAHFSFADKLTNAPVVGWNSAGPDEWSSQVIFHAGLMAPGHFSCVSTGGDTTIEIDGQHEVSYQQSPGSRTVSMSQFGVHNIYTGNEGHLLEETWFLEAFVSISTVPHGWCDAEGIALGRTSSSYAEAIAASRELAALRARKRTALELLRRR